MLLSLKSVTLRGAKRRSNRPDGCEAEVCMSHMDPVSGTDIDLFIEGIIPCSLHLHTNRQERGQKKVLNKVINIYG